MGVQSQHRYCPMVLPRQTSVNNGNRTILKQAEYVGITCTST